VEGRPYDVGMGGDGPRPRAIRQGLLEGWAPEAWAACVSGCASGRLRGFGEACLVGANPILGLYTADVTELSVYL
jgi:hypothetical protein